MKHLKKSLLTVLTVFTLFMVGTHGMEAKALAPAPAANCFGITDISSYLTWADISVVYANVDQVEVRLCDANMVQLDSKKCSSFTSGSRTPYVTFFNLQKNKLYYYQVRGLQYDKSYNLVPVTEWSVYKAFATPKPKVKLTSKKSKTVSFKAPKIKGVKKFKIYMSTKEKKGYKKIKTIKPGKTFKISKFKGKAFKYYKNYYYKIVPVLKKKAEVASNINGFKITKTFVL